MSQNAAKSKRPLLVAYPSSPSAEGDGGDAGAHDDDEGEVSQRPIKRDRSLSPTDPGSCPPPKRHCLPRPKWPDRYKFIKKEIEEARRLEQTGRIIPFVEGNWTTGVFISVPITEEFDEMVKLCIATLNDIKPLAKNAQRSSLVAGGFHVSLSRPLFLKEFEIAPFRELVRQAIRDCRVGRFSIGFTKLTAYNNDDLSRSFLAVDIGAGSSQLRRLVSHIDAALKKFGLETFYEDPKFHVSIATINAGNALESTDIDRLNSVASFVKFSFQITEVWWKFGSENIVKFGL